MRGIGDVSRQGSDLGQPTEHTRGPFEIVRAAAGRFGLSERRFDAAAPELEEDTEVAELLRKYVPSVSLQAVPGGGVPLVGSNCSNVRPS